MIKSRNKAVHRANRCVVGAVSLFAITSLVWPAATVRSEVFTWSPQCPNPTWFGVCDGEICDIENNTPLSLNNWGRSDCGIVAFPGVDDDVIISMGTVDQVATQINSMLVEPTGTFRFVGENISCPMLTNNGRIEVASAQTISTLNGGAQVENGGVIEFIPSGGSLRFFAATINNSGTIELNGQLIDGNDQSDVFNSGTIRSQGASEIDSLNNTGILDVQSGRLSLRRRITNSGQIIQSSSDAELEFGTQAESASIVGEFNVDVLGQAFCGPDSIFIPGGANRLDIRSPGAIFNFSGNGFELRQATMSCFPGAQFTNGPEGVFKNQSNYQIRCPILNEGHFIDELSGNNRDYQSTFENVGDYEVTGSGTVTTLGFSNFGLLRKTSVGTATVIGPWLNTGVVSVAAGELELGTTQSDLTLSGSYEIAPGAKLTIRPSTMTGVLSLDNQGELRIGRFTTNFNPTEAGLLIDVTGNPVDFAIASTAADATGNVIVGDATHLRIGDFDSPNSLLRIGLINQGLLELRNDTIWVNRLVNQNQLRINGADLSSPISFLDDLIRNEADMRVVGDQLATVDGTFEQAGNVLVESGGLRVERQLTVEPGSSLHVADGAEFQLGTVELSGDLVVSGKGAKSSGPENDFVSWSVGPAGASLFFDGDGMTAELLSISVAPGAQLEHRESSFLRMNRKFDTTIEGVIVNNGVIEIEDVFGSIGLQDDTVLVNNGTIRHLGDCRFLNEGSGLTSIKNSGTFIADNGATSLWQPFVENKGQLFLGSNDQRFLSGLSNFGGRLSTGGNIYLQSTGMPNGLLMLGGGIFQVESLLGDQRLIFGDVDFSGGTLVNGSEIGRLRLEGDLRLKGSGKRGFTVDIAGPPGVFSHDSITVTGTVTTPEVTPLNYGTLRVTSLDNYIPDIGDSYAILTCFSGVPAGYFENIITVGFPPNLTVEPAFESNRIRLDIAFRETPTIPGDMNCDGTVDTADIIGFATALTDREAYAFEIPICDVDRADMNEDGVLNGADIPVFIHALAP